MKAFRMSLRVLAALALVTVLAATGCTGSDPLQPNSNNFTVSVVVDNAATRFDIAKFRILQFNIRTVDPAGAGVTVEPLGLIGPVADQLDLDFNAATQASLTKNLANGTYRLEQIQIGSILFRDNDPPASTTTCEEAITIYPTSPSGGGRAVLFDFGQDITFTVDNTGSNVMTIHVDGQAFLAAFQQGWVLDCFPCAQGWCLNTTTGFGWQDILFSLEAPTFLSFQ